MDYLRGGWKINLSIAIDYTASNMDPDQPSSLHYVDPRGVKQNQYEQALLAVGRIVEPYALDGNFAMFGFGGKPTFMGSNQVSHCFNVNGSPDPRI